MSSVTPRASYNNNNNNYQSIVAGGGGATNLRPRASSVSSVSMARARSPSAVPFYNNNNTDASPQPRIPIAGQSRRRSSRSRNNNNDEDDDDETSFLDEVTDKISSVQRSVSRSWTTFLAENFPSVLEDSNKVNANENDAAKNNRGNNNGNINRTGLPPLANQQQRTNNTTTNSNNTNSPQSHQPKLNYRKLLKARLGLLKSQNRGGRRRSESREASATRPLSFNDDDGDDANNNNDENNKKEETTTSSSSLSSLFRWTQKLQTRQAGAFDEPRSSRLSSSSDDEGDYYSSSYHDRDSDDDDTNNNNNKDSAYSLMSPNNSLSNNNNNNNGSPSRASAACAQRAVEDLKQNHVDKRYWDANFDATKAELESFPSAVPDKDLPRELRMLDLLAKDRATQGRAVDGVLKQRLLENYPVFNSGMEHIQEVSKDLDLTATDCRSARKDLQHLKQTFILNGLKIPRLAQRKDRMIEVVDVLEAIELLQLRDREMHQLIKECRFRDALDLAANGDVIFSGELDELLKGVKVADKLNANWKQMTSSLGELADKAWDQCFFRGSFDEDRYEGVFETHALIGTGDAKRVKDVVGKTVRDSVQLGLMAASSSKNTNDIRQLVSGLEPDLIVVTICQMAARLADNIAICLRVLKYHEEESKKETYRLAMDYYDDDDDVEGGSQQQQDEEASSSPNATIVTSPQPGLPPLNLNKLTVAAAQQQQQQQRSSVSPAANNNTHHNSSKLNSSARRSHSRTHSGGVGGGGSQFFTALNTPRRQHQFLRSSSSSASLSMPRRQNSLSRSSLSRAGSPRESDNNNNGNGDQFDYGQGNYYNNNNTSNQKEMPIARRDDSPPNNQQQQSPEQLQKMEQEKHKNQDKILKDLHTASFKNLQQELPNIGNSVQRDLKTVAEILALDSEHFKLLPIDSALHCFYVLAMAVECTTHLNVDSFATRAARDTLRLFAKELVKIEVYHKGCRNIMESLVKENWMQVPDEQASANLTIVTGITPKDYQEDRKAVKNFVTASTTTLENNPFLLPHMVDQRKDALETLDTIRASINPYRNAVMNSVIRASQLYFEITCRVVVRFPPLAVEVAEWSCDVYSMYLYVVASTMIGVSKTDKLQDHYDFHPKARTILYELEKWASNLYELSFQGHSMNVTVRNNTNSTINNHFNNSNSSKISSSSSRAPSQPPTTVSESPQRAPFHFEQMPPSSSSRSAGVQELPTMTLAQLRAQANNTSTNNNNNNSQPTSTASFNSVATSSSSGAPSTTPQRSNPNSDSRFTNHTHEHMTGGTRNNNNNNNNNSNVDSITHNNINYQHSFIGRGEIQIRLSQDFPPPVYAGIHYAYESADHLFAVSERLNAIESCFVLLDVLKQSVASVKEVVSGHTMKSATERIDSLSDATDAILHVGCHRMCHALFPVTLLVDEISGSSWDKQNVTLVSSVSSLMNNNNNNGNTATIDSSAINKARGYQLSPEFKYGEWTTLIQNRCRNFFVQNAPRLKFASAHLRTAFWRHFVFNIQRAIVTGFAQSSRASDLVVAAMKAENEFILNYLKKLFPNNTNTNSGSSSGNSAFIREDHVSSFLDAYSLDLSGRIRWIRDNHEYYNSDDMTRWFMNLNSASIARHQMEQLLRDLKHSDCVPIELFVETERREERIYC